MSTARPSNALARSRADERAYIGRHTAYFIENYCRIEDKESPGSAIAFALWPGQKKALKILENHRFCMVLKARQLGMSWLVLAYALHKMISRPGSTVVAISRTETEARELVRRLGGMVERMREFFGPVEGGFWSSATAMRVRIGREGEEQSVFQAFASAPAAARSFSADLLIFDEWAYQAAAEEIWISGLPTVNRTKGGQVIGISTMAPGSFFEKLWRQGGAFTRIFLPWSTDPRRTAAWYERTKELLGENIYREYPATPQEAMRSPRGAFFTEFARHRHVCAEFEIPAGWRRYMAMDYGLDMLAALWMAVSPEGQAWIYREVYEPGLTIAQAAKAILQAEKEEEQIYCRYAPPDLFGRSQESGRPRTELFAREGIALEKASSDREAGWANVRDWLRDGPGGRPRLCIFCECENLIRTMGCIERDKRRPDDCAVQPHELTHAPDALRYMLAMRPRPWDETQEAQTKEYYEQVDDLLQYGS